MIERNETRKIEIYNYINEFIKEYGVCPSITEIADGMRCAKSTVHKYLVRLEEEGYIEKYGRNQIVTKQNAAPVERIPLIGMVACGMPRSAQEELQTYIPVDKRLLGNGEFFALRANGESMIEAGISDGDIVFVRYQPTAEDGQVVVAIIEDAEDGGVTATLKRFYRDKHKIRLHPENREMEDIIVDDAKIVGVAVKVLKNIS
ncbi:MAG: repressor LexA [Clostridia bacterium]|nr:repressor LexA [Clostridia bacterium]